MLADVLRGTHDGIAFNQHYEDDGAAIFEHACALGCEGIVSKRLGSPYRSGRTDHWLKIKNRAGERRKRIGAANMGARTKTNRDLSLSIA